MALYLTLSRKSTVVIALAVVAIIVGVAMLFLLASNLRQLKADAEVEEMAINQSRILLNQRLNHQKNAPAYQEKYDKLKLMIPVNPEEEEILRYFAFLAEEYDLRVQEIRFEGRIADEEQGFAQMPLSVTMEGRYRELIGLLNHLHRGDRAIRIDDIGITLSRGETAQIRITLAAVAFFAKSE